MDKHTFNTCVEQLFSESCALIPAEQFPRLPSLSNGEPGWYDFELKLWDKGEQLRQLLLTTGRTLSDTQAQTVLTICRDIRAMRGRQSFLMLLGRKKHAPYADTVAGLLSDPQVAGHAIDVLYKMGAQGYCREIEPFLKHEKSWIRNSAKRYLSKYS